MRGNSPTILATIVATALVCMTPGSFAEEAGDQQTNTQPAAPQGAPPSPQTDETLNKPAVTILGSHQAQSILGKEVRSAANEDMGRIVDVVVDRAGQPRAAVIDFGGFLGVGSRKIAVDWNAFHFSSAADNKDVITLDLTRDQVKAAPEYKDKQAVIVLGASGVLQSLPPD